MIEMGGATSSELAAHSPPVRRRPFLLPSLKTGSTASELDRASPSLWSMEKMGLAKLRRRGDGNELDRGSTPMAEVQRE